MADNLELTLAKSEMLARNENYSEATSILAQLIADHPEEPRVWATRAYVNGRQGYREAAIADMSRAISLREEPYFFFNRGLDYFVLGKYREAVDDFTRIIDLCDKHKSEYYKEAAFFCRADAHLRLKEYAKARSDCAHVSDDLPIWTDRLRRKSEILAECR